jgi:hypothetical protein
MALGLPVCEAFLPVARQRADLACLEHAARSVVVMVSANPMIAANPFIAHGVSEPLYCTVNYRAYVPYS